MCYLILQDANIRLVVIGQSAHHHIEVSLIHFVTYYVPHKFPLHKNNLVPVM